MIADGNAQDAESLRAGRTDRRERPRRAASICIGQIDDLGAANRFQSSIKGAICAAGRTPAADNVYPSPGIGAIVTCGMADSGLRYRLRAVHGGPIIWDASALIPCREGSDTQMPEVGFAALLARRTSLFDHL